MITTTEIASVSLLPSRRMFLGSGIAGGMLGLMPASASAANILPTGEWRLAIRNVHTNERFDAVFARDGRFVSAGLAELDHGMRDWRTGEEAPMDRRLLALLVSLRQSLGVSGGKPFDLISGYRSPTTNTALRSRGGAHTGVATKSQHMLGKATDIHLPGVPLDRLRDAARALAMGGVGYYPKDGFVHVDTARVRHW